MYCLTTVQRLFLLGAMGALLGAPICASAAEQAPPGDAVEFFQAIQDGQIEVKLIPRNVKEANVLIENKGQQPLSIKLPDAFAGVPVLAQFGGMGMGGGMGGMGMGGGMGGMGGMGGGGMQGVGGGMGGMGGGGMGGMGGMGGGMGMFNVDPGKVRRVKVPIVCLEHGKTDPNPRVRYEIRPIESLTDNRQVAEVCAMLGRGEVPRNVAQAAAWHLTDDMSWEELARKNRVQLSNGYTERYFAPQELAGAMQVVVQAGIRAEQRAPSTSTDDYSLSQN